MSFHVIERECEVISAARQYTIFATQVGTLDAVTSVQFENVGRGEDPKK